MTLTEHQHGSVRRSAPRQRPRLRPSFPRRHRLRATFAQHGSHVSTGQLDVPASLELGSSYFPAVDGMRAIAILSVLVFHTGIYSNGLFGVDVFFVLSGYLITFTLLREHHRTGSVHIGRFYLRRLKRLLPLLLVMLLLTLGALVLWGRPHELERFGEQAFASLLYVTNWEQVLAGQGYWDGAEALNPLGHMWSLAITEQFYLVWPFLLLVLLAIGRLLSRFVRARGHLAWQWSRATALIVLAVAIAGIVVGTNWTRLVYDGTNPDRVYLGTDTHFVGLVAGSAAAAISYLMLQAQAKRAVRNGGPSPTAGISVRIILGFFITVTSIVVTVMIVTLSVNASSYTEPWLYEYGFTLVAILSAILVLTLTSTHNLFARVFAWKPLVELGKVSYTLFLIHMPVYWIVSSTVPWTSSVDLLILGVPISMLVAAGLHHLVAEPIRMKIWGGKGVTVFLASLSLAVAGALVVPSFVNNLPKGTGDMRVLTLGDSLANDFASTLSGYAGDSFTVTDGGLPGCAIAGSSGQVTAVGITQKAPAGCNPWEKRWRTHIEQADPDVIVVNIAWDAVTQLFGEQRVDLLDPEFANTYRAELEKMAEMLEQSKASVLIANSRPYNAVVTPEQAAVFNALLAETLAQHPNLHLLDLSAAVCDESDCSPTTSNGEAMYLDNRVHFSDAGKQEIVGWLSAQINAVAVPR